MAAHVREMAARACAPLRCCMHGRDIRFADRGAEAAFKRDLEQVLVTYTGRSAVA
eukprot:CAMPEP_0197922900 /NCGR_PEP_ID=MMETSP1439-20131203/93053_1 /TAXON_ID=66791 /ORGANISM="Gonyaulax spinifera, Strain CCMP409" /LENGTH=54 /DNA_ID=CAMNT_0043545225 /DNA_START=15 /DNA_END=175 /DNA_ORIENTATION=+